MIKVEKGDVHLRGDSNMLITEFCLALRDFYRSIKECAGAEFADKALVGIGRYAVSDDCDYETLDACFGELVKVAKKAAEQKDDSDGGKSS